MINLCSEGIQTIWNTNVPNGNGAPLDASCDRAGAILISASLVTGMSSQDNKKRIAEISAALFPQFESYII